MSVQWTSEHVLALAPDAASAKNGRGLATDRKWVSLGIQHPLVWGECQGSGKTPYQTQIDLSEPAFRCSCPSRKFPCKHGLGLFLLLVEQPASFTDPEPPAWVVEWQTSRTQRQSKQATQQAKAQEQAVDPAAQAKRAAARQRKISAGIQELRLWLTDQVRQGLATMPQASYQVWETIAARMVDAQAPGLARQLRELASITHAGTGWSDQLLERLGRLYLLTEGFERLDSLPEAVQADLRTQIGWTLNQEDVLTGKPVTDIWVVAGQRLELDDRLKIRRTWLYGIRSATMALLLDFAHGSQAFEHNIWPGTGLEADLVFYPSAYPLRALVKTRQDAVSLSQPPPGYATLATAIAAYSQAFAQCPWLEQFPLLLRGVIPTYENQTARWFLHDTEGSCLPLSPRLDSRQAWQLRALSGGYPVTVLGEWDGTQLLPLSVWTEDGFYGLG